MQPRRSADLCREGLYKMHRNIQGFSLRDSNLKTRVPSVRPEIVVLNYIRIFEVLK